MEELNSELQSHKDSLALLSKHIKLVRHVPLEVATLRDDLLNIIAQLPAGNALYINTLIHITAPCENRSIEA